MVSITLTDGTQKHFTNGDEVLELTANPVRIHFDGEELQAFLQRKSLHNLRMSFMMFENQTLESSQRILNGIAAFPKSEKEFAKKIPTQKALDNSATFCT